MSIEWREPPEVDNRPPGHPEPEWAKELVSNPRKWGMVAIWPNRNQANYRQNRIMNGEYRWQENYPGSWEASFRDTERGFELFVKYIP